MCRELCGVALILISLRLCRVEGDTHEAGADMDAYGAADAADGQLIDLALIKRLAVGDVLLKELVVQAAVGEAQGHGEIYAARLGDLLVEAVIPRAGASGLAQKRDLAGVVSKRLSKPN